MDIVKFVSQLILLLLSRKVIGIPPSYISTKSANLELHVWYCRWISVLIAMTINSYRINWILNNRVFSILYQIHWIRWISWIQLEQLELKLKCLRGQLFNEYSKYRKLFYVRALVPKIWETHQFWFQFSQQILKVPVRSRSRLRLRIFQGHDKKTF